jgi:CelD/BcsL family acetyltransferase involved in cellulose biosynthesis
VSIHAQWVTSIDDLKVLGRRYDELVLSAGDAGIFYQLEWLERAWPYYRARLGGTLSFLIAERGGELVGLAPLVLVTKDWAHARQRVLGFIGGTWDELDNWMPGFLFATQVPDKQENIMILFAEMIASRRAAWDLLDLRLLRTSYPGHEALRTQLHDLHATPYQLTTPRARLEAGWASYWAGRSKRLMRILDRGRKRAAEDGLPVIHEVTPGVPAERREEIERIHRARQAQIRVTGRTRSSPFEDPLGQQVFWSLIDWAAASGRLRTHWLRIGGRTAAYVLALHHSNTTFAYFNAIEPSADRYHPGSLVLAGMIEREATEHGAVIIDMMAGANLTKTLLATEELSHTNLSVVNPYRRRSRIKHAWIRVAKELTLRLRLR